MGRQATGPDPGNSARIRLSPDTWLHGGGSWGFCFRAPVACFLGGRRPSAQGHRRRDLTLTDLFAFPHSSQLGLQCLREKRTRNLASHHGLQPAQTGQGSFTSTFRWSGFPSAGPSSSGASPFTAPSLTPQPSQGQVGGSSSPFEKRREVAPLGILRGARLGLPLLRLLSAPVGPTQRSPRS